MPEQPHESANTGKVALDRAWEEWNRVAMGMAKVWIGSVKEWVWRERSLPNLILLPESDPSVWIQLDWGQPVHIGVDAFMYLTLTWRQQID